MQDIARFQSEMYLKITLLVFEHYFVFFFLTSFITRYLYLILSSLSCLEVSLEVITVPLEFVPVFSLTNCFPSSWWHCDEDDDEDVQDYLILPLNYILSGFDQEFVQKSFSSSSPQCLFLLSVSDCFFFFFFNLKKSASMKGFLLHDSPPSVKLLLLSFILSFTFNFIFANWLWSRWQLSLPPLFFISSCSRVWHVVQMLD